MSDLIEYNWILLFAPCSQSVVKEFLVKVYERKYSFLQMQAFS